jgi:transposase
VARLVGVDRRSVRRWKSAHRRHRARALRARPAPGRPRKLLARQLAQLERRRLKGAKAAGFTTDLWTCPRVAQVIRRCFGVSYHVDHVSRLLRALGWSVQKPPRQAVERDAEAIRRWIKNTWPRIKKRRAPEGLAGLCG